MTPSAFAESLVAAFAASDATAYFAHFHRDATFLFHDTPGLVGSRADYEALWTQWEREDGFRVLTCESTDQHVQEHGDLAVFTHAVPDAEGSWQARRKSSTSGRRSCSSATATAGPASTSTCLPTLG